MEKHKKRSKAKRKCDCSDPGCPVHKGISHCNRVAKVRLTRCDYGERDVFRMCEGCAADALNSGVFA